MAADFIIKDDGDSLVNKKFSKLKSFEIKQNV